MRNLVLTLALIAVSPVITLIAEEGQSQGERCGVVKGTVMSVEPKGKFVLRTPKGDFTYMPQWVGGMPDKGGGFDQHMVAKINKLQPCDIVEVKWERDEHLRVVGLNVLGRAGGEKEGHGEGKPQDTGAYLDGPCPAEHCGMMRGQVASVDPKGRLVLKTDKGEETLVPQWRGGMPAEGGGFDREMVGKIAQLRPGQQVEVAWEWNERKRCVALKPLN